MTRKWILRKGDKLFESVSLKTLRTWVYEDRVQGNDLVSSDEGKTWTLAENTPELIPFFPSLSSSIPEISRGYVGKLERKTRSVEVIDMIPMIDMVFLLLIFFALTSTFEMQRFIELQLPKAASGGNLGKMETLTLYISKENHVFLENKRIELRTLPSKLKRPAQDGSQISLIIKGDEQVPHGKIVELMDIAHEVGVRKILVTVRRKGL